MMLVGSSVLPRPRPRPRSLPSRSHSQALLPSARPPPVCRRGTAPPRPGRSGPRPGRHRWRRDRGGARISCRWLAGDGRANSPLRYLLARVPGCAPHLPAPTRRLLAPPARWRPRRPRKLPPRAMAMASLARSRRHCAAAGLGAACSAFALCAEGQLGEPLRIIFILLNVFNGHQ